MESTDFKDIFEKDCFQAAVGEMLRQTDKVIQGELELVMEKFVEPLHEFLGKLLETLEPDPEASVKYICISFLRSAMYVGEPVLLVEAYRDIPFLEDPILVREMDGSWFFPCWEQYRQNLEQSIRQQSLGRYVREPERKSYDSKAISFMLVYLTVCLKYMVRKLETYPEWQGFERMKEFTLSYGEYMDWQFPLLRIREEIDPFLWDDREMSFRKFQNRIYEEKAFQDWIMDDCVFRECTFRHTVFEGTQFRSTRFFDCIFEDCHFREVEFGGSSILSCRVKNTVFEDCRFLGGLYQQGETKVFYPACTFRWSLLESVHWIQTPTNEAVFADCQIFDETKDYEEKAENEILYDTAGSADVESNPARSD